MNKKLYEHSYRDPRHFSFGRNWQKFLQTMNAEKIREAETSLTEFLGGQEAIRGNTFVDIGCGSGLFSLAAFRLGASRVISVDIDDFSLACAEELRQQAGSPAEWEIRKGSALDEAFMRGLGTYDIVYSWGVLHHTGDMYQALRNATLLAGPRSRLYIALYNKNERILEGSSPFWVRAKAFYNRIPQFGKVLFECAYTAYYILGLAASGRSPMRYIREYRTLRGMDFFTDIRDWLGGYPYEYATEESVRAFFFSLGFACMKTAPARSIGCNEFLLASIASEAAPEPEVAILLSVYNGERSLERCLVSISDQTYRNISIYCVDDASTDGSCRILSEWKEKLPFPMTIISNRENLGLTRSLNKGLAEISAPFTARIDADDWWAPEKLRLQMDFFAANPSYDVVGCNYTNIAHGKEHRVTLPETDREIHRSMIKRNPFAHSCVVFRTTSIKAIGSYAESIRYGQDFELWLRGYPHLCYYNIQRSLCFRQADSGISIEKQRAQMWQGIKTQTKYIRAYRLGPLAYLALLELLILVIAPDWLKRLKRKFML